MVIMKPSILQQTFRRPLQQKRWGYTQNVQIAKKSTKTNSRNRDNNTYPLMDYVHVNCMHSISFYINLFLSFQLTMTLQKLWG